MSLQLLLETLKVHNQTWLVFVVNTSTLELADLASSEFIDCVCYRTTSITISSIRILGGIVLGEISPNMVPEALAG